LGSLLNHKSFYSPLTPTLSPRERVKRGMENFEEEKPTNTKLESGQSLMSRWLTQKHKKSHRAFRWGGRPRPPSWFKDT
jgi:hypothetical protein